MQIVQKTNTKIFYGKQYHNKNNNLDWAIRLLIQLYKNVIHNEYIKQYKPMINVITSITMNEWISQ